MMETAQLLRGFWYAIYKALDLYPANLIC